MNDYPTFDAARAVTKIVLESDLQASAVRWAKARGWWARKLSSPQNRGIMDYMFAKNGHTELVEFKKPGNCKKPHRGLSDTQIEEHKAAHEAGNLPIVMDDLESFKRYMMNVETFLEHNVKAGVLWRELAAPYMPNLDK